MSGPPVRVRWTGIRPMLDYWGREIPRFYKVETLASAVERLLRGRDRFIIPSVRQVLGPVPITSLTFELFQEGSYQLVFRLRAVNAKGRQAVLGCVAAKQSDARSEVAQTEHQNLQELYARAPDFVVRTMLGGYVHLQSPRGQAGRERRVYVYLTQWLGGYHELGIDRTLQFFINVKRPHVFSRVETETIKGRIVEIIARTYDPAAGRCMEMPQIASGDFVITKPERGGPRLKLIACRRILSRVSPAKLIHSIASAEWDWGGRMFRLAPEDPRALAEALGRAVGLEQTNAWLDQYRSASLAKMHKPR